MLDFHPTPTKTLHDLHLEEIAETLSIPLELILRIANLRADDFDGKTGIIYKEGKKIPSCNLVNPDLIAGSLVGLKDNQASVIDRDGNVVGFGILDNGKWVIQQVVA